MSTQQLIAVGRRGSSRIARGLTPGPSPPGGGGTPQPPTTPNTPAPANSATTVSIHPTVTAVSAGATSFAIKFGVVNPPISSMSLGAVCSYSPPTLTYATIYYWQITATNSAGDTVGPIWSFTTMADPGPSSFVPNHPRIFLTTAKKAELVARKNANTTQYQQMKLFVDDSVALITQLTPGTLASGINTTATTITLNAGQGAAFPSSNFGVFIGTEYITITSRSGDVLTVNQRGAVVPDGYGWGQPAETHVANMPVWRQSSISFSLSSACCFGALLVQLGVSGYGSKTRALFAHGFALIWNNMRYTGVDFAWNYMSNGMRYYWHWLFTCWDWVRAEGVFSAEELAFYTTRLEAVGDFLISPTANAGLPSFYLAFHLVDNPTSPQRQRENGITNNIANGQLRGMLMYGAATYGDSSNAQAVWDYGKGYFDAYLKPSLIDGPFSGGNTGEGTGYDEATDEQMPDILDTILSATGEDVWLEVQTWAENFVKYRIHANAPGNSRSVTTTTGSGTSGSTTFMAAANADFVRGDQVRVGGVLDTTIADQSGTAWLLRDPLPSTVSGGTVQHSCNTYSRGDNFNVENQRDPVFNDGHISGLEHVFDKLRSSNPTLAAYAKYVIDNWSSVLWTSEHASSNREYYGAKFLSYDSSIVGVAPSAGLSLDHAASSLNSTGMYIGRSAWSKLCTWVQFFVTGYLWDHIHADINHYEIRRNGVPLTKELTGYDIGFSGLQSTAYGNFTGEYNFDGARAHNTVLMNNHSAANQRMPGSVTGSGATQIPGGARTERYEATSAYAYMRGNGSDRFRGPFHEYSVFVANPSPDYYPNNDAQVFVRDFLWLKPDLIVFADRLAYANATASPTTWTANFPVIPILTGQRLTVARSNQKLVQDIVYPSGATITVKNHGDNRVDGSPDLILYEGYFTETISNQTTATEWSLQVLQLMDSSASPATVTALTTVNANVAQIGTAYVVGGVKDATPVLPISYTYSGSPQHYVMGLAPSTPYHIVKSGGVATISAGSIGGDPVSSANGIVVF